MADWNELFRDEAHILREPDIFVVQFARLLRDHSMKRVLDWGAGAGRHTVYLASLGFSVVGMDPSPEGIREARRWLEAERLAAELQLVSPGGIPAADASFDAALSLYAIEHGRREQVLESIREIRRVLRPGGLGLITLSSAEDSMMLRGRSIEPGTFAPVEGPEKDIPHFLSTRSDIDDFFATVEPLYLTHVCSRLSALEGEARVDAHWAVIFRRS